MGPTAAWWAQRKIRRPRFLASNPRVVALDGTVRSPSPQHRSCRLTSRHLPPPPSPALKDRSWHPRPFFRVKCPIASVKLVRAFFWVASLIAGSFGSRSRFCLSDLMRRDRVSLRPVLSCHMPSSVNKLFRFHSIRCRCTLSIGIMCALLCITRCSSMIFCLLVVLQPLPYKTRFPTPEEPIFFAIIISRSSSCWVQRALFR